MSVREIIQKARGTNTQKAFVEILKREYAVKISQGLISKYESGKANPPTIVIDTCLGIIHDENISGEVSLADLENRIKKVLTGSSQAEARKAFAIILERLS